MSQQGHKTEGVKRIQTMWFYSFVFTGKERDEETCYGYCDDYQPHAVKRMFDYKNGMLYDMRWDEAGNLGQVSMAKLGEMFERGRFLFWTEDCCGCEHRLCQSNVVSNRMHAAVDDKYFSYYVYDHSGESCASREQSQACLSYAEMEQRRRSQRRLKLTGENKQQDVNADLMATYTVLNEPTLYPSAYMVLTNKGYTKHYYAGTERVAARLGGGGLDALQHVIASDEDLQWRADKLFKQSLDHVNHRVLGENDLNCIMRNKFSPEVLGEWIDGIPYHVRADVETEYWQFKEMVSSMLEDRNQGHEKEVFFYHSDHLGSASWITDYRGKAVQHIQYLPYGEPYINQRPFGYSERFTFTGKERDEETGYGYFGARYMDHELMTMWLSVDPMADKYPSISPYAYCSWNPVKLVDPDGRDFETIVDHEKKTITIRAQFYMCAGSEEQRKAFQKAINEWNSCEFEVSFPGAEKGSDNYRVCFDINNSNGEGPSNYVSFISDEDFNKYFKGLEGAGGFSDGRDIYMRNSSTNNQLLAHEMGHCLGMGDQYVSKEGLMYGTNSNDGNVSVARLGSTECRNLLSACGFNFKGPGSSAREQCKNIIPIGNAPSWFHNAKLSEVNNIIGYKEGTKKFRK